MRGLAMLAIAGFIVLACVESAAAERAGIPPPHYTEPTYVDRTGCVFIRTLVGGWHVWVQRLDTEKKPVCGHEPSTVQPDQDTAAGDGDRRT